MTKQQYKLCAPCLFGLESVLSGEVKRLGFTDITVTDGRVEFSSDVEGIARANLYLRTAERVLIVLDSFRAVTFQQLIDGAEKIPFEEYIGKKNAFPVKGWSLNSQLHSVPDCQSIIKKAAVKRLSRKYGVAWLEESGPAVQIQFSINKDVVTIMLDTSGIALHKRGYRKVANLAPIRETLAAGILDIARIYPDTKLYDPFCGSGTFLIEAAYKAKNIAPGIYRRFAAEKWDSLPSKIWQSGREEAIEGVRKDIEFVAFGSDISEEALEISEANARRAGIAGLIRLEKCDVKEFVVPAEKSLIVTNPPYGERLMAGEDLSALYRTMGSVFQPSQQTAYYIISSAEDFEQSFGRHADKKRKLYNGMLKCNLYQYLAQRNK
mgnify:CR=1 FL=1